MKMKRNAIFWSCWFAPWEKKIRGEFQEGGIGKFKKKNWKNCLGGASFGTCTEPTELWFVSVMGRSQSKQNGQ
jgi:hypothetical protein